jgi:hypothetical protein
MVKHVKTYKDVAFPDNKSSFWGKYRFGSGRSVKLNPMQAACTFECPVPSYRATYFRNVIIYKIFRICQGVEDGKAKSQLLYYSQHLPSNKIMVDFF